MVNHRVGALEQIGRIVQSSFQIDLAHLDLPAGLTADRHCRIE
jgi:hypothetical protein